jgi:hypothetical protein
VLLVPLVELVPPGPLVDVVEVGLVLVDFVDVEDLVDDVDFVEVEDFVEVVDVEVRVEVVELVVVDVGGPLSSRVAMLVLQVTTLPPGLPVPLHWCTWMSMARLTRLGATVQSTVPPPPLPEPLHWVTVAPVVLAG